MACKLCATAAPVVGSVVRMAVTVKDDTDNFIDAGTLTFKLLKPDGTLITYVYLTNPQLERDETGHYHVDYKVDIDGLWAFRFESTGAGEGASEDTFDVSRSNF